MPRARNTGRRLIKTRGTNRNTGWRREINKINTEILLLERRKDKLLEDNIEKPKQ